MNVAVIFGRRGSTGVPGKNTRTILSRPCCAYAILAAKKAHSIGAVYVSTDDPQIAALAHQHGAHVIERPESLARSDTPLADAITHAWEVIRERETGVRSVALLQANAPCITAPAVDAAVAMLDADASLDSVATVAELSQWGPTRARRIERGVLVPMTEGGSSDRHSGGPVYFGDGGVTVTRARVLDWLDAQPGIYPWQGERCGAIVQEPGPGDIDQEWQIPAAEWWLTRHGFTRSSTPYGPKSRKRLAKRALPAIATLQEEDVAGKIVAVIGRAPSLADSGLGEEIESADVVLRVNWVLPIAPELWDGAGIRTDILYLMPSGARLSRDRIARGLGIERRICDTRIRESIGQQVAQEVGGDPEYYIANSGTVAIFDALAKGASEVRAYGFDLHTSGSYVDTGKTHRNRARWSLARHSQRKIVAHNPDWDAVLLSGLLDDPRFRPDARFREVLEALRVPA